MYSLSKGQARVLKLARLGSPPGSRGWTPLQLTAIQFGLVSIEHGRLRITAKGESALADGEYDPTPIASFNRNGSITLNRPEGQIVLTRD